MATMQTVKKYKLLSDDTKTVDGRTLSRICALRSFSDVLEGTLGGYIESEHNLSHDGNWWIYDDAIACDHAQVSGNARVYDTAIACDQAQVFGNAQVWGRAQVRDQAQVSGDANVSGYAQVRDQAQVSGNAFIWDCAQVSGSAWISGNSIIAEDTAHMHF